MRCQENWNDSHLKTKTKFKILRQASLAKTLNFMFPKSLYQTVFYFPRYKRYRLKNRFQICRQIDQISEKYDAEYFETRTLISYINSFQPNLSEAIEFPLDFKILFGATSLMEPVLRYKGYKTNSLRFSE